MRSVVVSMCVFLGTLRIAQPGILAFLTTFSWSSGSRNARGEMAHNDAGVKKIPVDAHARKGAATIVPRLHQLACCLLRGQSRRSGCAPMTSGLPRQEDNFRARRDFAFVP
jgi:hypothetical protein